MYIPSRFKIDDVAIIHGFIKENPFGVLLSIEGDEIHETYTPFHLDKDGTLLGHIAKANSQWKSWAKNSKVKVLFNGPHSYISPNYYASEFNVPTWNYSAVSVTGTVEIIEDRELALNFLDTLVKDSENSSCPWKLDRNDERYMQLLSGVVVFSILPIDIQASFKMNQNKSEEDKNQVMDSLQQSGCPFDHQTATFMSEAISLPKKTQ